MGGSCSTHEGYEKYVLNFGQKSQRGHLENGGTAAGGIMLLGIFRKHCGKISTGIVAEDRDQ
jgi:hypothetical protein